MQWRIPLQLYYFSNTILTNDSKLFTLNNDEHSLSLMIFLAQVFEGALAGVSPGAVITCGLKLLLHLV